jgi:hypothetical protein
VSGFFSQFARYLQNPFDLLFILGHFIKAAMTWKPYGYYIESFFKNLHCWCFLTGMMTLSLVIPHFSLANLSRCFSQFARKPQNPFDLLCI